VTADANQIALHALHTRGREAWPGIELDVATFTAVATNSLRDGPFDGVRAADLYLAIACAAGIEQALAALDRHCLSTVTQGLVRRGHSTASAADIVQTLRVRFLVGERGCAPRIADYDGRASLSRWLGVAATRAAITAHRKCQHETALADLDIVGTTRSMELELLQRQFAVEFKAAVRSAFESLAPRERAVLRYQVSDRLGIDRIAAIYAVHRATAARWVAQARDALLDGVRHALQGRLRVSSDELDSLLRQVRSKLELDAGLFATPSAG
jgi:RNA polymerase sigma-70 factor (ECF subfamily)